jgi:hypothetical protein
MTEQPQHSPFGASVAHRWTVCHGSVKAQQGIDEEPSVWALEGTAGHTVAARCLESGQDAIEYAARIVDGVEIDDTVVDGVQVYLDAIRHDQKMRGGKLLVEVKFHLEHLHPLFWGTADCVRLGNDKVLSVYDLKLGRGKIVEVMHGNGPNIQLGYYGLGAYHSLDRVVKQLGIKQVELVVVQPRAWHRDGPVRRARFEFEEIEVLGATLVEAAAACEAWDAKFVPGDHCEFCRAAPTCRALRDYAFEMAQLDFQEGVGMTMDSGERTVNPVTMDNAELSRTLDAIDVIEMWIGAVRAHAHIVAASREGLPGWKLVDKQARRKWVDETKAAQELAFAFGLADTAIFAHSLLTPAQIEKMLPPADRKSEAFKALCPARSSGTTLVRADNPRPERKPVDADFIGESDEW